MRGIRPEQIPRSRRPIPSDIALNNELRKQSLHSPVMEYVDSLIDIDRWHCNYDYMPWIETPADMVCLVQAYNGYWVSGYYHALTGRLFTAKLMDRTAPPPPTLAVHKQPVPWKGITERVIERGNS